MKLDHKIIRAANVSALSEAVCLWINENLHEILSVSFTQEYILQVAIIFFWRADRLTPPEVK